MLGRGWLWVLVLIGVGSACSDDRKMTGKTVKEDLVPSRPIEEVLQSHTPQLMSIPGVIGTGLGNADGKPCILVLVSKETPSLRDSIPPSIEGHRVRIQEVGEVKPLEGRP